MPIAENVANSAGAAESLLRESLIDVARNGWIGCLVDLSCCNNLLFYKPVLSGTLEFPITPKMMAFLTNREAGKPVAEALHE
jgi:hypothetical protein